jgi:hypothetical protein
MSLISESQLTEELSIGKRRVQPIEDDLDKILTLVHAHAQNVIRMSNSGKTLAIQLNRLPSFLTGALDQNSVRATEMAHVQSNKLMLQQQHTMYDNVVLDYTAFRSKVLKMKSDVEQLLKARPVVHTLEIKVLRNKEDRVKRRARGEYLSTREEQNLKDNEILLDRQLRGFNGLRQAVLSQIADICSAGPELAAKTYAGFLQSQMDVANALTIQAASSLSLSHEMKTKSEAEAKVSRAPVVAFGETVTWGPGATPANTPAQEESVLVASPSPESSFNFISPSYSNDGPDLLCFDSVQAAAQQSSDSDSLADLFLEQSKFPEAPLRVAPVLTNFDIPVHLHTSAPVKAVSAPITVTTKSKPKDAFADLLDF